MTMKLTFQMACILHPECNFLHRYFRCQLPLEKVDVEVKVKTMQGNHAFRRKDISGNQVESLEHRTLLLPLPHPEDENIFGVRRETWSKAQAPTTNLSATNPSITNPDATSPIKQQHHG